MPITTDTFGNTFAGNFLAGDPWEPNDLLACMRAALGSNDRANINRSTSSRWRIDWRPNIVAETLTGVISTPSANIIGNTNVSNSLGFTLTANSRMAISYSDNPTTSGYGLYLLDSGSSNVPIFEPDGGTLLPSLSVSATYNAVVRSSCCSFYIKDGTTHIFYSQGVLENALLSFPDNRYSIAIRTRSTTSRIKSNYSLSGVVNNFFSSTAIANYPHNNGSPTTDEMGLYLRRTSDNQHLGYIPNVFKFTVDGGATTPAIGDIVNLNMFAATGFYAGQEIIKCIVVGRLGNTSDTDLTGDFLLMKVAS